MQLADLPPELTLQILNHLGSEFYYQDVRRLLVCKRWYLMAWQIFTRDLHLSPKSFQAFSILSKDDEKIRPIRSHIKSVRLHLPGTPRWPAFQVSHGRDFANVKQSIAKFNTDLTAFAETLEALPNMDSLQIEAHPEYPNPERAFTYRSYLDGQTMASILSVSHLTALDLDLCGMRSLGRPGDSSDIHICDSISSLLPQLLRLRCRMGSVCECLLRPPPNEEQLSLEELIISLTITRFSGFEIPYRCPSHCQPNSNISYPQLKTNIENQAASLVPRLANPKLVRVLSHNAPHSIMYSFDVLTGVRTRLPHGSAWDAVGQVQEDEPELVESSSEAYEEAFV